MAGVVVEVGNGLLRVRRGGAVVEVYPAEVQRLVDALLEAGAQLESYRARAEQRGQGEPAAGAALSVEAQQAAFEALTGLGVQPRTARHVASTYDPAEVLGWAAYVQRARGVENRGAFVVARVTACEPAPASMREPDQDRGDRPRFGRDELGEYIEH